MTPRIWRRAQPPILLLVTPVAGCGGVVAYKKLKERRSRKREIRRKITEGTATVNAKESAGAAVLFQMSFSCPLVFPSFFFLFPLLLPFYHTFRLREKVGEEDGVMGRARVVCFHGRDEIGRNQVLA